MGAPQYTGNLLLCGWRLSYNDGGVCPGDARYLQYSSKQNTVVGLGESLGGGAISGRLQGGVVLNSEFRPCTRSRPHAITL